MARVGEVVLVCKCSDGEYRRIKTDDEGRFVVVGEVGGGGGGDVTVLNWPSGFDVNNWPTGFLAQVTNWPSSWSVDNFPAFPSSIAVSNFPSSFGVSNFPSSFQVSNFPSSFAISNFPSSQAVTGPLTDAQLRAAALAVTGPVTDAQLRATPLPVTGSFAAAPQPSTLWVSQTAAISQAVTASLPAVAGQFHYITSIEVVSYAGATIATAATAVTITTTNLPGNPVFNHQRLHTAGQSFSSGLRLAGNPLKSAVAGTATTVVCPVLTGCIWRINVTYYTGP